MTEDKLKRIKALLEKHKHNYQASVAGPLLISAIEKIIDEE